MAIDSDVRRTYFSSMMTPNASAKQRQPAELYAHYMTQLHMRSNPNSRPSSVAGTPRATQGVVTAAVPASFDTAPIRRLRKAQPLYVDDAAGVTSHRRNIARPTPLKGRGCPPPDHFQPEFKPSKRLIMGRSFAAQRDILVHHEDSPFMPGSPTSVAGSDAFMSPGSQSPTSLSKSMDSVLFSLAVRQANTSMGSRPGTAAGQPRLCLKMTELSHRSSLQGPGLNIITEAPLKRPLRKPGTAAPTTDTKARVLVLSEDVTPPTLPLGTDLRGLNLDLTAVSNNPREAMINNRWARQAFEAGLVGGLPSERPSTAPPRSASVDNRNEARRRYQESSVANVDVLTYRHSGGICNPDYKLDDRRMPAPQHTAHSPEAAREAYYASRAGYATSRVRSLLSQRSYA